MFKSYYVVWKLEKNKEKKTDISGLNRTMQYGNSSAIQSYVTTEKGLNRTMQYGNFWGGLP